MEKGKEEQGLSVQSMPTIKKRVKCPKCGAEIEVEFEIELAPLIPVLGGPLLSMPFQTDKKEEPDGD
jgi:hypothetical protein